MKQNILNRIITKDLILRYIFLSISLLVSAISFNIFIRPAQIVTGGITGIAMILNQFINVDQAILVFIISAFTMVLSIIFLSKEDFIAALFITIVYPLFLGFTANLEYVFKLENKDMLIIIIFAGVLNGITNGIVYKTGLNTGGIGLISKIIYKYTKISISKVNTIISFIIIAFGGYIFGFNKVLYAVIYLFVTEVISDKVLLGISQNKMFYIISEKSDNIKQFIVDELKHDVTEFDAIGSYTKQKKKMLMTLIPSGEHYLLKNAIKEIDKKSFAFISDSYETKGQDLSIRSR